jgi:integrase
MSVYKLQRFRGGWATAVYVDGKRVIRHQLAAKSAGDAAREHEAYAAGLARPVDPTVRQIWDAYVKDLEGRAVVETMRWTGKPILAAFGELRPADITVDKCRAYTRSRRPRRDGTIHTELGHLRMVLLWAKKRRMIDEVPHVERPAKPAPAERHLTRHQFARLVDASVEVRHVAVFCHLAIASAGRASALLDLEWSRVDFSRGLVFLGLPNAIRPMKGRATVPMTDTLRAALQTAREMARSDYVIEYGGKRVGSVKKGLAAAGRRAGLGHVTPHMLRHSAAVWMAEAGVPMAEIAQVLGHRDAKITASVYAVFSPTHLRSAVSALEVGGVKKVR